MQCIFLYFSMALTIPAADRQDVCRKMMADTDTPFSADALVARLRVCRPEDDGSGGDVLSADDAGEAGHKNRKAVAVLIPVVDRVCGMQACFLQSAHQVCAIIPIRYPFLAGGGGKRLRWSHASLRLPGQCRFIIPVPAIR